MEDGKEEASGGGGEEASRLHERVPRPGVSSALKEPRENHSPAAIYVSYFLIIHFMYMSML